MVEHAKPEPVATATRFQTHVEETPDVEEAEGIELFLDCDGKYRWYEEGVDTRVSSDTLRGAIAAGERRWDHFVLVELRGRVVESGEEIEDSHASDELAESQKK